VVDAWHKAVAYWEKNPAESNQIMARAVGEWLQDPRLFADVLTGVRFYNREANVKFFGTPQKPGALYGVVQNALDVTRGLGALPVKVAPSDLVNHSFVK
jgi:NitT/TauT family transport system substrate-binding protein